MKKNLFIILILAVSLFLINKSINYINSIEKKIDSITAAETKNQFLERVQTSNTFQNLNFQTPDFVEVAKKTINNVVHVKNSTNISNDFSLEDLIFGRRQQRPSIGTGSGVIISPDGYIITNSHVVKNADKIEITTNDNQRFEASLIGSDEQNDIALLKINSEEDFH